MLSRLFKSLTPLVIGSALYLTTLESTACAQDSKRDQQVRQSDDVIRINTSLAQTDVMVFDKRGHFVDSVKPSQFELRIDGQPVPIAFLDLISTQSGRETAQLALARGDATTTSRSAVAELDDGGRTYFFFVDDVHL